MITGEYIFGKDVPLEEDFSGNQGLEAVDGEYPFYPIEDFTSNWSISEADGYLVINFTGNGFAGFYVGGSHSYTITYQSSTWNLTDSFCIDQAFISF